MDTELLRTFLQVAKTGRFRLAAEQLCLTQSAVSARIKLLEGEMGVRLFERNKHGVALTDAGNRLQLLGKRLVEVFGEERGRFLEGVGQQVLASGNPETLEFPLDVPSGHIWIMARVSPILVPGESPHSTVVLVRDITDRKKAEAKIQEQLERLTMLRPE